MNILIVLTYYRPHWTGLTQYAARLAEGLAKRGHRVKVICSQHQKNLPQEETLSRVKVFRLPSAYQFTRTQITPSFLPKLFQLAKQSDVIVAYLPLAEILLVTLTAKILNKKLYLVHNGDLVMPTRGILNRFLEKIYLLTSAFSIRFSNGIIVQTKDYSEKSGLLSKFRNKWKLILPLYSIKKPKLKEIESFRKENHLEKKVVIGFAGRFVEEKGVDYLLRAIPLIRSKIPRAHFVFAGDYKISYEKFWEKIEALVGKNKNNITLLGIVNCQKMAAFFSSLEVLVLPSRSDCFPSVQVEAMLLGIPIVCTNIPGARWVVGTTKMGLLVKPKSQIALAEGIVKVLENKRRFVRPEKQIKKIFNYEETIKKYETLFRS